MNTTQKKKGRPTTNPKINRLEIRLSVSENKLLDECVERTGKTRTDIIIDGITMVHKTTQEIAL